MCPPSLVNIYFFPFLQGADRAAAPGHRRGKREKGGGERGTSCSPAAADRFSLPSLSLFPQVVQKTVDVVFPPPAGAQYQPPPLDRFKPIGVLTGPQAKPRMVRGREGGERCFCLSRRPGPSRGGGAGQERPSLLALSCPCLLPLLLLHMPLDFWRLSILHLQSARARSVSPTRRPPLAAPPAAAAGSLMGPTSSSSRAGAGRASMRPAAVNLSIPPPAAAAGGGGGVTAPAPGKRPSATVLLPRVPEAEAGSTSDQENNPPASAPAAAPAAAGGVVEGDAKEEAVERREASPQSSAAPGDPSLQLVQA